MGLSGRRRRASGWSSPSLASAPSLLGMYRFRKRPVREREVRGVAELFGLASPPHPPTTRRLGYGGVGGTTKGGCGAWPCGCISIDGAAPIAAPPLPPLFLLLFGGGGVTEPCGEEESRVASNG